MANFPILDRNPGVKGFSEEIDPGAMQISKKASGLPVLNKLFTFAGKTWRHTRYLVSQANKEEYLTFYETNKDVPFGWTNEQEGAPPYEVIFLAPPKCTLDKLKSRWRIQFIFAQYSPL